MGDTCDNPNACPGMLDMKTEMAGLRQDSQRLHKVIESQTATSAQINMTMIEQTAQMKHIAESLSEHRRHNEKDHDETFNRLRHIEVEYPQAISTAKAETLKEVGVLKVKEAKSSTKADSKLSGWDLMKILGSMGALIAVMQFFGG